MPPISRGSATTRLISSLTQAMHSSLVPMSGAKMYSCSPRSSCASARISCSFLSAGIFGSPRSTTLPPPCGRPAAAFLKVIARASRMHSSVVTSVAMRTPPIAGPLATLSMTSTAFRPTDGSQACTILAGPSSSANEKRSSMQSAPFWSVCYPTMAMAACSIRRDHDPPFNYRWLHRFLNDMDQTI